MTFPAHVVDHAVPIAAPPTAVWPLLTDPAQVSRWMAPFAFDTTWQVGTPLAIRGTLNGHPYAETGTVLAFDPPALLRYTHWSRLWRVPDAPGNHAILELRLVPTPAGADLRLHHELPEVEAIAEHARFFWQVSLDQVRRLAEGEP